MRRVPPAPRPVPTRHGWRAVALGVGLLGAVAVPPSAAHASACTNTTAPDLTCEGSGWLSDVWSIDPTNLSNYGDCVAFPTQPGPERIFPFECPGDVTVDIVLADTECELDLYVIGPACNPGQSCLAHDTGAGSGTGIQGLVTFDCVAGLTAYVVVEGWALDAVPSTCPSNMFGPKSDFGLYAFCDEICDDGADNDGDGDVDCDDTDCTCIEDCTLPGDDDGDGLADCADPDCAGTLTCCDLDGDGVLADTPACGGTDCDDGSAAIAPGLPDVPADGVDSDCDGVDLCFVDADGDGYGTTTTAPGDDLDCADGGGWADNDDDCWDQGATGPSIFPDAPEVAGDGYDQNCDGVDHCFRDLDGDGFGTDPAQPGPGPVCTVAGWSDVGGDCLDQGTGASAAFPGAAEVCDGVDNDCDGALDDDDPDLSGTLDVFTDGDGDGYGDPATAQTISGCDLPPGTVAFGGDCDDTDPSRSPGVDEVPYDGLDQDCSGADLVDVDGDGSLGPAGTGPDCDDTEPLVGPGRPELVNGVDDDCDGLIDEASDVFDDDGDGFTETGGDCDDTNADIHPGAPEVCDGVDEDCDGTPDDGTSCYDDDGDGFTEDAGDCHDGDDRMYPTATEIDGNGVDDDCDGYADVVVLDDDGDGFTVAGGDCDDTNGDVRPGGVEVLNGIDDDCDGRIDEGTPEFDDDNDGYSEQVGDCHDGDPTVYPGAEDVDNGIDDDCNGLVDDQGLAGDQDRDGWTLADGDCDDADPAVAPYAPERANGVDDDCDGLIDDGLGDVDGDGFTEDEGDCDDTEGWVNPDAAEVCDQLDNDCDGFTDRSPEGVSVCVGSDAPAGRGGCATVDPVSGAWPWLLLPVLLGRRRDER